MFKQATAILLLVAFVAQTFSNGFVMLGYYTNPAAFAKNCVNKAKPKLHCNGKCQVMKKLQEEEKKDQQMPERKFEKKMEILASHSFSYNIESASIILPGLLSASENTPLTNISYSFFHPPKV